MWGFYFFKIEKGEENRTTCEAVGGGDKAWGGSSMADRE